MGPQQVRATNSCCSDAFQTKLQDGEFMCAGNSEDVVFFSRQDRSRCRDFLTLDDW